MGKELHPYRRNNYELKDVECFVIIIPARSTTTRRLGGLEGDLPGTIWAHLWSPAMETGNIFLPILIVIKTKQNIIKLNVNFEKDRTTGKKACLSRICEVAKREKDGLVLKAKMPKVKVGEIAKIYEMVKMD